VQHRLLPILALLLSALGGGCWSDPGSLPRLESVEPSRLAARTAQGLLLRGLDFPESEARLLLQSPWGTRELHAPQRLDSETLLAALPEDLAPGRYGLLLAFAGTPPCELPDALLLEAPAVPPRDLEGPVVWVRAPGGDQGQRAGAWLWVEVEAEDPSGVARLGLRVEGLLHSQAQRVVSAGGTSGWARFRVWIPPELEPLQMFWLLPEAWDRLGNWSLGRHASSVIVCGPGGPEDLQVPCPD